MRDCIFQSAAGRHSSVQPGRQTCFSEAPMPASNSGSPGPQIVRKQASKPTPPLCRRPLRENFDGKSCADSRSTLSAPQIQPRLRHLRNVLPALCDVVKADEVNLFSAAVLRDFQQIQHTQEAGLPRQFGSDIREADILDRIDDNLAAVHGVTAANLHVRAQPDAHTAGNLAFPDTVPQTFGNCLLYTSDAAD